jgi:hypothetical protein
MRWAIIQLLWGEKEEHVGTAVIRKYETRRPLVTPRCRQEENIKSFV